jgi:lipopolysaccharide/colanic/teichoic acid biosynthesis glycosyltransferase
MNASVRAVKRLMDVAGSACGLGMALPLLPVLALAIRLDSPGPIFYRQRRAGQLKEGDEISFEEFDMVKFRTMVVDAERNTGAVLAAKNDPRVTRIGRFLRKFRLDELPQLWNVLKGDMSLVGPRPERPERQVNLALAIPFFEERMRGVKPGLTGLAQISLGYSGQPTDRSPVLRLMGHIVNPFELDYGAEEGEPVDVEADDMRVKLLYDLPYVAAMERFGSFIALDLLVILRTPLVVFKGVGR